MRLNFSVLALLLCFAAGCGSASQDDLVFVDDGSAAQTPSGTTSATSDDDIVVPPLPEPTAPVESSGFEVAEQTQGTTAGLSSSSISWFWKPVSDSDGNVVVLVDPVGVTVVATGSAGAETLRDVGPSNDRGTTARGSVPGCRFGRNVIVEFYDSRGRIVPIVNGNYRVQLPGRLPARGI